MERLHKMVITSWELKEKIVRSGKRNFSFKCNM